MKTVIIYETVHGNTRKVAEELARVARRHGPTEIVPVGDAPADLLEGADLVLIGGPTHVHGMSWSATRQGGGPTGEGAEHPAGRDVPGPGLRDWFRHLGREQHPAAAAFDTRSEGPGILTGRASLGISRRLRHYGFQEVAAPRSFLVGRDDVLEDGELDRACEWAESVMESLPAYAVH